LAALHSVTPQEIFVGLGSSELIDLAARALLRPGRKGLTADGTYAPFSIAILASGAQLVRVPLRDFAFDLAAMAGTVTDDTGIVYLANPNNPTGTAFGDGQLREFLRAVPESVLVVLDEAYIHYAERPDMPHSVELYRQRPNLLVLRTFSKVYGLAGLRIGYGVGQASLIAAMNKLRTPFNVSGVAQCAALAALDDHAHVRRCIDTNRAERKRLFAALCELGLRVVPSETNFMFISIGPEAATISSELLHAGVIVRPLGWMGFPEAIRISVGTAEENDKLLAAMGRVLSAQEKAS
jgi:histidinol-phosphate aminotransferase